MTTSPAYQTKELFDLSAILKRGLPKSGEISTDLANVKYALDQKIDYEGFAKSIDFIAQAEKAKIKSKAELEDLMIRLLIEHSISKIFQDNVSEMSKELFSFFKLDAGQMSKMFKLYFGNPELGLENSTLIYVGNDLSVISKILAQGDSCYFLDRLKEKETPNLIKNPVLNFILVKCLLEMAANRKSKFNEILCKNFIAGLLLGDFNNYLILSDENKSLIEYHIDSIWNSAKANLHKQKGINACAAELFTHYEMITGELQENTNQFLEALKALSSASNVLMKSKR